MTTVLITGITGFVGKALVTELLRAYRVVGTYHDRAPADNEQALYEYLHMDIENEREVSSVCSDIRADVVIHAAAVTERSAIPAASRRYQEINGDGTACLARLAGTANPRVHFIYLSSVDVYGDMPGTMPVGEDHTCTPTTEYGKSKYRGEREILSLYHEGLLQSATICRLAPLYDRGDIRVFRRRVMAPAGNIFLRYGSGGQMFSALALPNLVAFISYLLHSGNTAGFETYNVCDDRPYRFHGVCDVLRRSQNAGDAYCLPVPAGLVYAGVVLAGLMWPRRKRWLRSSYRKLYSDRVFDCGRMLSTGFTPLHSLQSLISPGSV